MTYTVHKRIQIFLAFLLILALCATNLGTGIAAAPGNGTIFFTVDYLIQGEALNNDQRCSSSSYRLKIVMEGVGEPNQLGELPGVTIVADLAVDPGAGAWWTKEPAGTHAYPATVKLGTLPTPDGKTMTYPMLVEPVPATPDFTWERRCIREDGTVEDATINLDPAQFINNFYIFVLGAGGLKEVEPGEYLSKFRFFVNNDGSRLIEQRVWWGDRRLPSLVVEPDVEGVFLSAVPATVDVTYDPRWADDVNTNGSVWVKLGPNQWLRRPQSAPQKFIEQIPLGTTAPTNKPIEGWAALDVNNNRSEYQSKPFTVAPQPTIVQLDEVTASKNRVQKSITYKLERNMPPVPFEKNWLVPTWFPPPLKGKDTKIKAQLKLIDEYESTATPAVHVNKLGFEGELEVGRYGGKLGIEGTANIQYSAAGLQFLSGQGKADLQIGIKETIGPFELVPTLKPVAAAVSLDSWLEQYAKVEAGVFIFGAGDVQIEQGAGGIDWKAVVLSGVRPIVKFQIGKDDGVVRLELEGKGEFRLRFHLNMPGDLFQGGEGELVFTGGLTVLHCKWSKEVKYTFGGQVMASTGEGDGGNIATCGRDPSAQAAAEQWLAAALPVQSAQLLATQAVSMTLVDQSIADAAPTVDATGSTLCWVQYRTAAPVGGESEIVCAQGTAPTFQTPVAITQDTYADAEPSVALAAANTPVVSWWRHDDPNRSSTATLDAAFLSHGEVMASAFQPETNQWSSPVVLGTPGVLDYAPVTAGNASNGALVAWRNNPANQLGGFGDTADVVKVARYNPITKSWSSAEALHTTRGLLDVAAAYGSNEAALLYVIDQDGDAATVNDTELFAQRLVGGVWQPVLRLTNNVVADHDPQLAYRADGTPVLVWLQQADNGQTFLGTQDGWNGAPTLTLMEGPTAPVALQSLTLNSAGAAVALWRSHYPVSDGSEQGDLTFAVRHAATGVWSAPLRLTQDAAYEWSATAVWHGNDTFDTIYQQRKADNTHAIQLHQQPITPADASVAAADMTLAPVNPTPGAAVTATVAIRNQGMLPQANVLVTFNERDGANDAQKRVIATHTVPVLRGGEAVTLTLPYVSGLGANQLQVTLSCNGPCGNVSNDQANVVVNQADLVLDNAGVVNGPAGPIVRAYVRNMGVVSTTMAVMNVAAGFPEGEIDLGTAFLQINGETGLQPGATAVGELRLPIDNVFSSTVPLTVTVAPILEQPDFDQTNNRKVLLWSRLPDLSLKAGFAELTQGADATALTLTVFNDGYLPTPDSSVTVYTAAPDAGGSIIGTVPVPALEPYTQTEVRLVLPGNVQRAWMRVNTEQSFSETSHANNDSFVGLPDLTETSPLTYRLLLPIVRR